MILATGYERQPIAKFNSNDVDEGGGVGRGELWQQGRSDGEDGRRDPHWPLESFTGLVETINDSNTLMKAFAVPES